MELCPGRPIPHNDVDNPRIPEDAVPGANFEPTKTSNFPFYSPSPLPSGFKNSSANSSLNEATIPEGSECEVGLDKNFGYSKHILTKYELGEEVDRGHFGYTCSVKGKKGGIEGAGSGCQGYFQSKDDHSYCYRDIRREVKILRALTGHKNLVQFYDAYEDDDNVYIVMD
ncbi:hypothetical protein NE237_008417 [Protea cynaroides]|uniref:Protein kinase domain-containing protein n=1 Tax=Protea cynaroides TaxID=273540 RepID=A0A9Q0QZN1_9MAGN|nr:hypothetical protein NE237_008417 [Protea cynaroides]